jgi:hypothetical protein
LDSGFSTLIPLELPPQLTRLPALAAVPAEMTTVFKKCLRLNLFVIIIFLLSMAGTQCFDYKASRYIWIIDPFCMFFGSSKQRHQAAASTPKCRAQPYQLSLAWVPLAIVFLAVTGTHLCYAIAVYLEQIPACIPYWDSCTSISRTGRLLPGKLIFKAFMLPMAMLSLLFWYVLSRWMLRYVGCGTLLWYLGLIGNLFVIAYIVALGESGESYQRVRRVGVTLYFGLTLFAQLWFIYLARRTLCARFGMAVRRIVNLMYGLMVLTFLVCIISVVLSAAYSGYHRIDDAFEWNIALLMNVHFLLHFFLWRALDVKVELL